MNRLLVLLSATLVLLSASAARADTAGISFTSPGNSINNAQGFSLGFVFTATSSFAVDSLGYYDNGGLTEVHQVGLYNSSGTLLASATVTGTGTQVGFFNYTAISDVDLIAGQTYQVVGTSGFVDPYAFETVGFSTASNITFDENRYTGGNTLAFGTITEPSVTNGWFGPNFEEASTVPEPSTLALFGTGLLSACGLVRRRLQS
ncbi:MAG TPA: DUF4082 domain-containing protein [Candidatus Sulfotelmatobacter sp.]